MHDNKKVALPIASKTGLILQTGTLSQETRFIGTFASAARIIRTFRAYHTLQRCSFTIGWLALHEKAL